MTPERTNLSVERGIIKRIYLENFVTYNKVEIKPGRNLNLIIGPNGTGKSTIVCAIVLGLGGRPNVIGRASHVGEYVKAGCTSAKIEIELADLNDKSLVITRNFTVESKSTWAINGKAANTKEVMEMTKSLNIQVDNLCQFLPQDKVQDFSKMNKQDLLENTERSVGDPKLLEYHLKLKEFRNREKNLETAIADKTRLLESEIQKYEGMKEIVGNIKERKIIKKRIKTLKQKRAWITYDLSRKKLTDAKVGRDKAAVEMKELDEQLKPITDVIKNLESHMKGLKKIVETHNTQMSGKTSHVRKLMEELHKKERKIQDIETNRENNIQIEENRDHEINIAVQQKNKLENDLQLLIQEFGSEESLAAAQQKNKLEFDTHRATVDKYITDINAAKGQEEYYNSQIRNLTAEIQAAKNVEAKRLEILRARSPDAYTGVLWLRENRDKFASTIHEPMLLNIHVKDAQYSKYIESTLALRDLFAFVCEDKSDMNRLMGFLRDQQKLKINVVHSDPGKVIKMQPNIPIDNIRQFGFQHYLISLFNAPLPILKYLVQMYNVNNIPLGTNAVEENADRVPNRLRHFFSQNNVYSVSTSKYTGQKSTRISRVFGNGTLSIILDVTRLELLTEKRDKLNVQKAGILEEIRALEVKLKQANGELDELRSAKHKCQRNLQTFETLKARIHMTENKIRDLQRERTSAEQIKETATTQIQEVLKTQLQIYNQYNTLLSDCYKFVITNEQIKFELNIQQRNFVMKKNESQDLRERCMEAEQTFRKLENELSSLRNDTKKLYEVALESTDNISPQDKAFKPFNTAFAKLPFTIREIDVQLQTAQAKVYCLGDNNADGETILRNYEKLQVNVEKLKEDIETMKLQGKTVEQETEEMRGLWLAPLQDLVNRINKNFGAYFCLINCVGEISLQHPTNVNDFDQYGLCIKVKFRNSEPLQELTRQRQSGGERAVTTAIYMIALQELSTVPFRCVDEINQGMDAVNERRVFELIVKITGEANNSQYFLLTPKLLSHLNYGKNVTIHCIFNGPFMVPCTTFNTETYCERLIDGRGQPDN